MYQKAFFVKNGESSCQILETKSPVEARKIGKKITNYDSKVWNNAAEDCMCKAMYVKSSLVCAKFLRQTKGTQLAEATPGDTYWGTEISVHNKDFFNPNKWREKHCRQGVVKGETNPWLIYRSQICLTKTLYYLTVMNGMCNSAVSNDIKI